MRVSPYRRGSLRGRWPIGVIKNTKQSDDGLGVPAAVYTFERFARPDVRKLCLTGRVWDNSGISLTVNSHQEKGRPSCLLKQEEPLIFQPYITAKSLSNRNQIRTRETLGEPVKTNHI